MLEAVRLKSEGLRLGDPELKHNPPDRVAASGTSFVPPRGGDRSRPGQPLRCHRSRIAEGSDVTCSRSPEARYAGEETLIPASTAKPACGQRSPELHPRSHSS